MLLQDFSDPLLVSLFASCWDMVHEPRLPITDIAEVHSLQQHQQQLPHRH